MRSYRIKLKTSQKCFIKKSNQFSPSLIEKYNNPIMAEKQIPQILNAEVNETRLTEKAATV